MQCTHRGRQADGTWCVNVKHHASKDSIALFKPPADIVEAAAKTGLSAQSIRNVCPSYYTPIECVVVAFMAGAKGPALNWQSYIAATGGRNND